MWIMHEFLSCYLIVAETQEDQTAIQVWGILMIELIFTVCLLTQGDTCEENRLIYTDVTPMTCMMGAQAQLAEWSNAHPKWVVASWRCGWVDLVSKNT